MQKRVDELKATMEASTDAQERRELAKLIETLESDVDKQLLKNYDDNRDELSLSHQFESSTKVDYDV